MNTFAERVIAFECEGETLIGIVAAPTGGACEKKSAVLIVVGGPQYRAGAHRMFVKLARELACAGYASMRFDVRGMGDSGGAQRNFEAVSPDIAAAVAALRSATAPTAPIVLFGLCDGASASMLFIDERHDHGVNGMVAANPWVRSEAGQARTHLRHYYLQRLASRDFWRNALQGRLSMSAVGEFIKKAATSLQPSTAAKNSTDLAYMERMARGSQALDGARLAVALSGNDLTAREFETYAASSARWRCVLEDPRATVWRFETADHTFSLPQGVTQLSAAMVAWLTDLTLRSELPHGGR